GTIGCMAEAREENRDVKRKTKGAPIASVILGDGSLVELVFNAARRQTFLCVYDAGRWTLQDQVDRGPNQHLVPFSPDNNLIKNDVVLLPSEPCTYESEDALVAEIAAFIHRYVDLSATFEKVATY